MILSRLPLINAGGCLILAGIVIFQWYREHQYLSTIEEKNSLIHQTQVSLQKQTTLTQSLQKDIAALKESIRINQATLDQTTQSLAEKTTASNDLQTALNQSQTELNALKTQIPTWQEALQARDTRISELQEKLDLALKRLNEAISKLKSNSSPKSSTPPAHSSN